MPLHEPWVSARVFKGTCSPGPGRGRLGQMRRAGSKGGGDCPSGAGDWCRGGFYGKFARVLQRQLARVRQVDDYGVVDRRGVQ
jgi:hypothetical protein